MVHTALSSYTDKYRILFIHMKFVLNYKKHKEYY